MNKIYCKACKIDRSGIRYYEEAAIYIPCSLLSKLFHLICDGDIVRETINDEGWKKYIHRQEPYDKRKAAMRKELAKRYKVEEIDATEIMIFTPDHLDYIFNSMGCSNLSTEDFIL